MKTYPNFLLPIALIASLTLSVFAPPAAHAGDPPKKVPAKKTAKKPAPPVSTGEQSQGTQQMAGGDGVFGTVYTMVNGSDNHYNLQFIRARYTLEPHNDYSGSMPMPDQKLFILTFAVKNPNKDHDLDLGGIDITLVDENDNNYALGSGTTRIAANGTKEAYITLKPGQGIGQDPIANELSLAITVPGNAKIKKILLKGGRATMPDEKVLRFNIAGTTGGSPKNIIAPLPKYAADPTDPTGAVTVETANGVMGKYYPDGYFAIRLDSVVLSPDAVLKGNKAEDGKEWAVATMTCKNIYSKEASTFDLGGEKIILRDADNEKYNVDEAGKRKATRDEEAGSVYVDKNEELTFRYFFQVPKATKLKSLFFQSGKYGHSYQWDLTASH